MNKVSKLLLILGITLSTQMVASAQNNIVLQLDDGACSVPIATSTTVTVGANGDIMVDVDDTNLPPCFGSQGGALSVVLTVADSVDGDLTIEPSGSFDVAWSVANYLTNVTSCTATGGTVGWQTDFAANPEQGSGNYQPANNTTFSINCTNGADIQTVAVIVSGTSGTFPPPVPAFCAAEDNSGLNRTSNFSILDDLQNSQASIFEQIWGPWRGDGDSVFIFIPKQTYVAIAFTADYPGIVANALAEIKYVGNPGTSPTAISISECPGDLMKPYSILPRIIVSWKAAPRVQAWSCKSAELTRIFAI